jgi:glycosyltransferase involved in cell wall biosynthesis
MEDDMIEDIRSVVSAVIPTRHRASLVTRAVYSALRQTFADLEVVVVIDGPDEETVHALHQIEDLRLRVIALPQSIGGAGARNTGVEAARGTWIAFLDDDDEWLPNKIERQLEVAVQSCFALPIIACPVITRRPQGEFIYPRRFPKPSEPISEYLLARNSLGFGEGLIQTSGIFTKRELLQQVPFRTDLRKHQDWDWFLRVSTLEQVSIQFVSEPLAIWYRLETRKSVSSTYDYNYSLSWIRGNRTLVTPRAYAAFILVEVGAQASAQGYWQAFFPLLWEAIRSGRPKLIDYLLYLGMWLIPRNTRHLYRFLQGKKSSVAQSLSHIQT